MSWSRTFFAAALALFGLSVAFAQTSQSKPASPTFKNLQVYPADISREQLMANMKFYSQSLGVRCTHCHVGVEGQPASFDFASDDRPAKDIARRMIRMTFRINDEDFGITDVPGVKVTCYTCHLGSRRPLTEPAEGATPN